MHIQFSNLMFANSLSHGAHAKGMSGEYAPSSLLYNISKFAPIFIEIIQSIKVNTLNQNQYAKGARLGKMVFSLNFCSLLWEAHTGPKSCLIKQFFRLCYSKRNLLFENVP